MVQQRPQARYDSNIELRNGIFFGPQILMESSLLEQVQEALSGLETGRVPISQFEALLEAALGEGTLAVSEAHYLLSDALRSGLIPVDTFHRLGIELDPEASPGRSFESNRTVLRPREVLTAARAQDPGDLPLEREFVTTGSVLSNRYFLERELGSGGMGDVYFARDQDVPGEVFAIKVLKPEVREIPSSLDLMREEVRKTRALAHPNIVGAYSVNLDGPTIYILMEYLEGKTLDALIDDDFGRGMPFLRAWPVIQDICSALAYAHDHSVIHCDLKPSNIFITTAGKAKLLDFGIAQAARGGSGRFDTASLGAVTVAYATCEMMEARKPEQRDDIYSLACVIYEMLSGRHPFDKLSALDAQQKGLKAPRIALLSRRQNSALARALAFDRAKRTSTVEDLLAALAPSSRRGTAVAVAAVAAVLVSIGASWWLWGTSRHEPKPSAPVATAPPTSVNTDQPRSANEAAPVLDTRPTLPVATSSNPCKEPLSVAALERALNAGIDSSAKAALMASDSLEGQNALTQLRASVDCLSALRAVGIASADSKRFLDQAKSMLSEP